MKKILFALCMIALIASPVYAADSSDDANHVISLTDPTGLGGGIQNIAISNGSTAAYSGAATAGWNSGVGTAGQVMCVVTASLKADPDIALYIGVRGSNDPDISEDNNVYQLPNSTLGDPSPTVTNATALGYTAGTDLAASWSVRGGS